MDLSDLLIILLSYQELIQRSDDDDFVKEREGEGEMASARVMRESVLGKIIMT